MKILISCCNKQKYPDTELPDIHLFEVDLENGEIKPVPLIIPNGPPVNGLTDLQKNDQGIWVVANPGNRKFSCLINLDLSYQIQSVFSLATALDPHSICAVGKKFYLASTGNDSILEIIPGQSIQVHYSLNTGKDTIHLNSLCIFEDALYASAFGTRKEKLMSSSDSGYLFRVENGEKVMDELYHPHSLTSRHGHMYFCNSSKATVCRGDGQTLMVPNGYIRGLAFFDSWILVGSSLGRKTSKSTGEILNNPAQSGIKSGFSGVHLFHSLNGDLSKARLEKSISLEKFAGELYDILCL